MKIEGMNKELVKGMLEERAMIALEMDKLDKRYPDVFCGVSLDVERAIHIWKPETLRKMANLLGEKVVIEQYTEEEVEAYRYLGKMWFSFEYAEKKWRVFSLYENESEVIG